MHFVTPALAVGSLADAGNRDCRQSNGIDAVLSLLKVDFRAGRHHATIPIADREALPPRKLVAATAFIDRQIRAGRSVLVHCMMGISRSPAIVAAYLHEYAGMGLADAIAWVCHRHPQAEPHPALFRSLCRHYGQEGYCPPQAAMIGKKLHGQPAPAELSANENPLGPSPLALAALAEALATCHRYPDRHANALRDALASRLGVAGEQILFGNGSCEILDLVARACLAPGEKAIIPSPAFLPYRSAVRKAHGRIDLVPLKDFKQDLAAMAERVDENTRLVFLGHPNNPTGVGLDRDELEHFLDRLPDQVTVLVDEAYREYVTRPDAAAPLACLLAGRPVVAVRTFSKLHGLAGLRIGYAAVPKRLLAAIEAVRPHYNTSSLAQTAALAALADKEHPERSLAANREGLSTLAAGCASLGLEYVPSEANFLLVRTGDADRLTAGLEKLGVRVKSGTPFGLPEHLRISVGTQADNFRCLDALWALLADSQYNATQGVEAW